MIDKMKVYQDTELSSKAVSVYLYLCERASKETKSCYPSMKTIAKDLHLSLASVKENLIEELQHLSEVLEEIGFVTMAEKAAISILLNEFEKEQKNPPLKKR